MSEPSSKPVYLVDTSIEPAIIRIEGRASFQNSACLQEFFATMLKQGRTRFVVDFQGCSSMDSTFLGMMAGAALDVRRRGPGGGSLVLVRVGPRNLELIRNLGLHRLLTVDTTMDTKAPEPTTAAAPLACTPIKSEVESARMVLAAHETLVSVDEGNRTKFQDVLSFLKARIDQG